MIKNHLDLCDTVGMVEEHLKWVGLLTEEITDIIFTIASGKLDHFMNVNEAGIASIKMDLMAEVMCGIKNDVKSIKAAVEAERLDEPKEAPEDEPGEDHKDDEAEAAEIRSEMVEAKINTIATYAGIIEHKPDWLDRLRKLENAAFDLAVGETEK